MHFGMSVIMDLVKWTGPMLKMLASTCSLQTVELWIFLVETLKIKVNSTYAGTDSQDAISVFKISSSKAITIMSYNVKICPTVAQTVK